MSAEEECLITNRCTVGRGNWNHDPEAWNGIKPHKIPICRTAVERLVSFWFHIAVIRKIILTSQVIRGLAKQPKFLTDFRS